MSAKGFQKLCATAQECLSNNFLSFFAAVSGAVMSLHFEQVVHLNDECPIVMCYSSSCGTGKYYNVMYHKRATFVLCNQMWILNAF